MPVENYKKLTIAMIAVLIIGIVVLVVTTSDHRKENLSPSVTPRNTIPSGPLTDSATQPPTEQLKSLPDNPEELAVLGDKFFDAGRYDMAAQIYEKVLQLNPNDADTYNDMGLALHYLKKSDAAIDTLRKGTQVMPSYQRVWLSLGFVLMSTGKSEEAKAVLKKASEMDPSTDMGREAKKMLGQIK